jgi:hypothetical protein
MKGFAEIELVDKTIIKANYDSKGNGKGYTECKFSFS